MEQKQALPIVNSYLLDTEIISCTRHRSMSSTDPKQCFLPHSLANFLQAGLQYTKSFAPGVPRRPGAGLVEGSIGRDGASGVLKHQVVCHKA